MYDKAIEILKTITSYGYEAYIVGGYPRDLYLKRSSMDVDICTDAKPMELVNIFDNVQINNPYGSVLLVYDNIKYEITTFRKEGKYIKNRRPSKIEYIDSFEEDLKRRDFTINTLCIDQNGKEIDLMHAKADMDAKIIRMVGDPKVRLKEDALRILRAIRFATTLNFKLETKLELTIKKYHNLLKKISYDRRRQELDRIFSSDNKEYGIKLLNDLKLSDPLEIPKLKNIKITPSMIVTWSELDVLDIYPFNSNERDTIIKINEVKNENLLDKNILYKYGLYICTLASELTNTSKKELNKVYASIQIHSKGDIALKPEEICVLLKKEPGKFLKEIINDLEYKLINDELVNDKEALTEYVMKTYS